MDESLLARLTRGSRLWLLSALLVLAACDSSTSMVEEEPPEAPAPEEEGAIVAGVNVDVLFAPPTDAEINTILDEWEARRPLTRTVAAFREEVAVSTDLAGKSATMRVVSHTVGGRRHYGAIVEPAETAAARSLPVVVLCHGGDGGVAVDEMLQAISALGEAASRFVYVVPSFRSEPLAAAGQVFTSDGPPSPWDLDVDDALTLLTATLENTPAADPERIAVVGFSRGADVALLMGLRDERIDLVVDFFGPTDFFGDLAKLVINQALLGFVIPLPGVAFLNDTYVQPLKDGALSIDEVRLELVRRSPVYFTDALQQFQLQLHHGRRDLIVPVAESQRLIAVMDTLGRAAPDFEFFLYDDGGHDPNSLPGSLDRTAAFLARLLP